MCRDADKILALPKDMFALVADTAKGTDGHMLLRATEIFARTENDLRYSVSPRIVFETAVLKASMPQSDYDTESLLSRIAALEKRLEEGSFSARSVGDPAAENANGAEGGGESFGAPRALPKLRVGVARLCRRRKRECPRHEKRRSRV